MRLFLIPLFLCTLSANTGDPIEPISLAETPSPAGDSNTGTPPPPPTALASSSGSSAAAAAAALAAPELEDLATYKEHLLASSEPPTGSPVGESGALSSGGGASSLEEEGGGAPDVVPVLVTETEAEGAPRQQQRTNQDGASAPQDFNAHVSSVVHLTASPVGWK